MRMKSLKSHRKAHDGHLIVDGEFEAEEELQDLVAIEPKSEFAITISMDNTPLYVLGME